jgi:hypothetical protein
MKLYLRLLALFYFIGFALHFADFFDLRLKFSEMSFGWKTWIVYLGLLDLFAAIGLWYQHAAGIFLFFLVAISQIVAYVGFKDYFGDQVSLIYFHLITMAIYLALIKYEDKIRAKLFKEL